MPLAGLTKLGPLAPPFVSALFIVADVINLQQDRRLLGIRLHELPAFLAFSLAMRPLEMVGMYWKLIDRAGVGRFVSKNFA